MSCVGAGLLCELGECPACAAADGSFLDDLDLPECSDAGAIGGAKARLGALHPAPFPVDPSLDAEEISIQGTPHATELDDGSLVGADRVRDLATEVDPVHAQTVRPGALGVKQEKESISWSEYAAELAAGAGAPTWDMTDEARSWLEQAMLRLARGDVGLALDILRQQGAAAMEGCLYDFLRGAWDELEPGTPFEDGPHIRAICDHVQTQLEERAIALGLMPRPPGWTGMRAQDLLIRVPPRCLKTLIATICGTAWAWLRWPTMRILSLSSNPRVMTEAADKTRSLIRSEWYQGTFRPAWKIRADMDGLTKFANTAGGWRQSRGMTSRITGEGADWLLVDDPHDGAEVYSKAKRDAVNNKWRRAVSSRVNDPRTAIRTGIMQALHFQDWGQERIADRWGVLLIRMQHELRDAARRSPYGWVDWRTVEGESIIPARFTQAWCAKERVDKGPIDWAAQYQQDPAPIDGGIVRESDLRYYDELPPNLERLVISVDASFKKTTSGSRVSVLVVGQRGPERYVVDNDTRPMHLEDTIQAIEAMRARYPRARTILVEDKANGSEIIRRLREKYPGIVAVNPGSNSKEARLMACQSYFVGHCVFFPRVAGWLDDMKYEVCTFPNAPKDDQVDALVQALLFLRSSTGAARSCAGCQL